ncbi:MAG: class I SAM-dependent methyltransferase [Ignavibacteriaceae bacterium]|nr:class I SAM-dependent methyltransferase [Ignavibacteriaceae bacterium]
MRTDLMDLSKYPTDEGVILISPVKNDFENLYIELRKKEQRVYSDEEVMKLPFAGISNSHKKEWDLRAKSFLRFEKYLGMKKENLNILDLGCGNCWFCGQISKIFNNNYYCIDVNLTELKQGKRIFDSNKLKFLYADIFTAEFPLSSFDLIIINSAIHYFPDFKKIIDRLLGLLNENGEIHIIDSPFYDESESANAKQRTKDYFNSIGFPQMADNYFHHTWKELSTFRYKILYDSSSLKNRLLKLLLIKNSPFPWICLTKEVDTI